MTQITGYDVVDQIFSLDHLSLFRARRQYDEKSVLLKTPGCHAGQASVDQFLESDFAFSQKFQLPFLLSEPLPKNAAGKFLIEYNDYGFCTLSEWSQCVNENDRVYDALCIVRELFGQLAAAHQQGLFFGRLNPRTILLNELDGSLCFADANALFEKSTLDKATFFHADLLSFFSPKLNSENAKYEHIDDLSVIGQLLYWLLTRCCVYELDDRSNISSGVEFNAYQLDVGALNEHVPGFVADFVKRLLAMARSEAFESLAAAKRAIDTCLKALSTDSGDSGSADNSNLGYRFITRDVVFARELHWRELNQYLSPAQPTAGIVLLDGGRGSGKSTLLRKIGEKAEKKGYCTLLLPPGSSSVVSITSKVVALIEQLVAQISVTSSVFLRDKLNQRQVAGLLNLCPSLTRLFKQKHSRNWSVLDFSPVEIMASFSVLIRALTEQQDLSLLLLWDDIDKDAGDIALLLSMLSPHIQSGTLKFIASSNENNTKAANQTLAAVETEITLISLGAFQSDDAVKFINAQLGDPVIGADSLADILIEKTDGQPLSLQFALYQLLSRGLLTKHPYQNLWYWNREYLNASAPLDHNQYLSDAKDKLSGVCVSMLTYAACLGEHFKLSLLAELSGFSKAVLAIMFKPARQYGLVQEAAQQETTNERLSFSSLFIRDYFLNLLPEKERRYINGRMLKQIYRGMRKDVSTEASDSFTWLGYLEDFVVDSNPSVIERREFANLCMQQAIKAGILGVKDEAKSLLNLATKILGDDAWQNDNRQMQYLNHLLLALSIHEKDERSIESFYRKTSIHARTPSDVTRALIIRIKHRSKTVDTSRLVDLSVSQLKQEGVAIPDVIDQAAIHKRLKALMNSADLINTKFWAKRSLDATDSGVLLPELMMCTASACKNSEPGLATYLRLSELSNSVDKGVSSFTAENLAYFAAMVGDILGEHPLASRLGNVAVNMPEHLVVDTEAAQYILENQIEAWNPDGRSRSIEDLLIESSASLWRGKAIVTRLYMMLFTQSDFKQLYRLVTTALAHPALSHAELRQCVYALQELLHVANGSFAVSGDVCLLGVNRHSDISCGDVFVEHVLQLADVIYSMLTGVNETNESVLSWRNDDLELEGHVLMPYAYYFSTLHATRCAKNLADSGEFYLLQAGIQLNCARFEQWAYQNPVTFAAIYQASQAELHVLTGSIEEALDHYYEAIKQLKERQQCSLLLALTIEQLGVFCREHDHSSIGKFYFHQAARIYRDLSADALASAIELEGGIEDKFSDATQLLQSEAANKFSEQNASLQDSYYNVVSRVAWHTKASRVYWLKIEEGDFAILAGYQQDVSETSQSGLTTLPIDFLNMLYHSSSSFLLDENKAQFVCYLDKYLREIMPRSLLAVPIFENEQVKSIFYCEHRNKRGVFTADHVDYIRAQSEQLTMADKISLLIEQRDQASKLFDDVIENTTQGIAIHRKGKLLFCNLALKRLLCLDESVSLEQVEKSKVLELPIGADVDSGANGSDRYERVIECVDNTRRVLRFNNREIYWQSELATVSNIENITDLHLVEERVARLTHHDALTNLPNRNLFLQHAKSNFDQATAKQRKCVVMYFNIDDFNEINNSLGHQVGDRLLITIAQNLVDSVKAKDIVARVNGDRFAILLNDVVEVKDAANIASRILSTLKGPHLVEDQAITTAMSVGISVYPDDSQNGEKLFRFAELAMYHAKRSGSNTYRFYQSQMNRDVLTRQGLIEDLYEAFLTKDLSLHYQPKISLATGDVVGVECLLRWPSHPQIGPAEFVPLAESNGFIIPLGEWVIQKACEQIRRWDNSVSVAVNLSPVQLRDSGFADKVAKILQDTQADPELLEFEITESAVMHNVSEAIQIMHDLHALGVSLSIDDFGTGYSSLTYLNNFPVQTVKVDKSFVSDLESDHGSSAIAKAIIDLGHTLGMKVVAEGVETEAQKKYLSDYGCDFVQGFLYSKALPEDQFNSRYRLNRTVLH